jgi:GNAT superfamily N-acetyltransferase
LRKSGRNLTRGPCATITEEFMKIRHADAAAGLAVENTFIALDDLETKIGEASVQEFMVPVLCPERPHQILVRASCEDEAENALLGAATARALVLARQKPDAPTLVYCECAPGDAVRMSALEALGYRDEDGLVRTRRVLKHGPIIKRLPQGCTIVRDYLADETECKFFLERYGAMFGRGRDMAWLKGLKSLPDFARLLVISPAGLAGEMVVWSEEKRGVIGIVETTPAWQHKGVASYLMDLARLYFLDRGLGEAYFDVRTRLIGAARLAATSGFRPAEALMRYPSIDVS